MHFRLVTIYPSSKVTEGGRVRHLANPDGDAIVERLEAFNEKNVTTHIQLCKHHSL